MSPVFATFFCPGLDLCHCSSIQSVLQSKSACLCSVFQELRSEIELEVLGDTEDLQMSFTTICPNGSVLPDLKRCSNIKPGETVSSSALNGSSVLLTGWSDTNNNNKR